MKTVTRRNFVAAGAAAGTILSLGACDKKPSASTDRADGTNCTGAETPCCPAETPSPSPDTKSADVCSPASTLIFPCSGAADTGEISDLAARQLTRKGKGKMFCLAGVAGGIEPIVNATKKAETLIAVDGCAMGCVKKCLTTAGFTGFSHIVVTDLGLEKGKSPATKENIDKVAGKVAELFA